MTALRSEERLPISYPEAPTAGPFGPLWALLARKVARRLDAGLAVGSLRATFPDGTRRTLGGRGPGVSAEATLHSWRGLVRVATGGSIGLYQAWEKGEWSSDNPVELFQLFVSNSGAMGNTVRARGPWRWAARFGHWLHRNTRAGSRRNIHAHYDLGNDFYSAWLDRAMVYSSARFDRGATDLASAQEDKLATIAERIDGAASVLEIGCGWGALAARLAAGGAQVTALSLSDEQLAYARTNHPGIEFRKQDYRDVSGQFDAIASVEMVEAVGREFWPDFFDCIARNLKPGGRAAIQYIAIRDDLFPAYAASADFIQAYVFPGGMLVSESEFRRLAASRSLDWTDLVEFGLDYAETLRIWRENFEAAVAEGRLPEQFDERFQRLWRFYLMYCEGGFRGGAITVAQVTLVKSA
ncbi:MAG: class I SAM-dependent methyltransferase [Novosphingobium sp.]